MKICIKFTVLALLTLFLSCEVTFNEDLREYIDNKVARTPLDFSLSDSVTIDNYDSVNMGYNISDNVVSCTITNNENVDIYLSAFDGVDGDFTVDPYDAFTLFSDESFTFNVTFNYTSDNYNTRVSKEVKFYDTDGRAYTFYLWSTSRTQPLSIYSEDDELISIFDLGNWSDNRTQIVKVKNEGLESLNVTSISLPTNVSLNSSSYFNMEINDEVEINLEYSSNTTTISGENLVVTSDFEKDLSGGKTLVIYAGGDIPITITDSSGVDTSNSLYIGNYTTGDDPIVKSYTITNSSLFPMDLTVSMDDEDSFTTTFVNSITIDENDTYSVNVSFSPTGDSGSKSGYVNLYDENSGRTYTITLSGDYTI